MILQWQWQLDTMHAKYNLLDSQVINNEIGPHPALHVMVHFLHDVTCNRGCRPLAALCSLQMCFWWNQWYGCCIVVNCLFQALVYLVLQWGWIEVSDMWMLCTSSALLHLATGVCLRLPAMIIWQIGQGASTLSLQHWNCWKWLLDVAVSMDTTQLKTSAKSRVNLFGLFSLESN